MLYTRHISHDLNHMFKPSGKRVLLSALAAVFVLFILTPSTGNARLRSMGAAEMKKSTGQAGFTQFIMDNNTARFFLDIHMETFATMDTLGSGGSTEDEESGEWDILWDDMTIGSSYDEPLEIDGLVFIADFDEASNLERIIVGSNRLQGNVSATMSRFSGAYNDALIGGSGSMITGNKADLGRQTFHFDSNGNQNRDMGLYFVLDMKGPDAGMNVVAGFDRKTLSELTPEMWWNMP